MSTVQQLIQEVGTARKQYIETIASVATEKAVWKPNEASWNIIDITEHLFWAEQGGIIGMWKTLHAIRNGSIAKKYESVHQNMSIEQVIALTWKEKEKVPEVAAPRIGGPLLFWQLSLQGLQEMLQALGNDIQDNELRLQAHPHPISGALDFQQRLEFLRFHINRHKEQVQNILASM